MGYFCLFCRTFLICEGGTLTLTAKALQFQAPKAKIKWNLDLELIEEIKREPSGYLSCGKIHLQIHTETKTSKCSNGQIWQCQVCEEINETTFEMVGSSKFKCKICGLIQKGELSEIKIDESPTKPNPNLNPESKPVSLPWKCDVCEEINEAQRMKCFSCGFGRAKIEEIDISTEGQWKCPTCTCINTKQDQICAICDSAAPPSNVFGAQIISKARYKFSFKSGGSTTFHSKLQKTWTEALQRNKTAESAETILTIGISGLLRRQEDLNSAAEASLCTAFSDLDALMRSAGEMVHLAAKISEKMKMTSTSDLSCRERNTFSDLVESLGISREDEHLEIEADSNSFAFYDTIARSVSGLVQTMISKTGTRVYSLADVYCIYNRTRTTGSLIAPADLLKAARQLSKLALPVRLHKFTQKGMLCLVPAQDVDPHHLYTLIQQILAEKGTFLTAIDLADKLNISLFLAGQQLQMAEASGKIVRDAKRKDLPAFYPNLIR